MRRIAVYGCGKKAKELLKILNAEHKDYNIVYFIVTKKEMDTFMGYSVKALDETYPDDFDILIIATSLYRDEIIEQLYKRRNGEEYIQKIKGLSNITESAPYKCVQVHTLAGERIIYLYNREDKIIPGHMEITGHNWSDYMIEDFFFLIKKYTGNDVSDGIFLDVGANIGTTSIYVAKRFKGMRVIGFEPLKENYRLFRTNVSLNELGNVTCENIALSDAEGEMSFIYNKENSGDSHYVEEFELKEVERVTTKTIDGYIQEKGINVNDIKMIWMDCQGYEMPILLGAKNVIKKYSIPLLQEYNISVYVERDELEKMVAFLKNVYSSFVDMSDQYKKKHTIDELDTYSYSLIESGKNYTDLLFF